MDLEGIMLSEKSQTEIEKHCMTSLLYGILKNATLQQVVLGKLDSCMQINEVRTLPHITDKNKLKMA